MRKAAFVGNNNGRRMGESNGKKKWARSGN